MRRAWNPLPGVQYDGPAPHAAAVDVGDQPAGSTVMSDEQPFYAPDKRPAPARTPKPGEQIWRLRKDDRVMTCELRDDDRAGAGFDLQLFRDGELRASRRFANADGARFVAESYRQDQIRTGWTE